MDIASAQQYASSKGYHHIMYCRDDMLKDEDEGTYIRGKTAIFFKREMVRPWLGGMSQCDWYSRGKINFLDTLGGYLCYFNVSNLS